MAQFDVEGYSMEPGPGKPFRLSKHQVDSLKSIKAYLDKTTERDPAKLHQYRTFLAHLLPQLISIRETERSAAISNPLLEEAILQAKHLQSQLTLTKEPAKLTGSPEEILSAFDPKDLARFKEEFEYLLKKCCEVEDLMKESYQEADRLLQKLWKDSDKFSDKYVTLTTRFGWEGERLAAKITFTDERDFSHVFKVASRMLKLSRVTIILPSKKLLLSPSEFEEKFSELKEKLTDGDIIFESSEGNLHLRFSKKRNSIQLVWDEARPTVNDSEYRLCAYYAMEYGYKKGEKISEA